MSRCIHCTRCVRFGQEIAGIMELGMIGRGEHSEIVSFVGKTVDSELSGNAIDLCPVGALTSKPFRYSARTWELTRRPSVSPHDGLGANLTVQVKQNEVMRVLPRANEEVNECWLADRDRFSYEGLNSPQRLLHPMVKQDGQWREVDWVVALDAVATGLKRVKAQHGGGAIGALATPHQTLEELHLFAKLARGFGSENIDFRLRQADTSADGRRAGAPWLGMTIAEFARLDRALVVGSTLRKDHPLLAHRLRQATKKGAQLSVIHAAGDDLLMPVAHQRIVAPSQLPLALAEVVKAAAELKSMPVPAELSAALAPVQPGDAAKAIAGSLASGKAAGVFLGNFAEHHPQAALLHALAQALAGMLGMRFGFLGEAANSVGGYLANALPGAAGLGAARMLAEPRKAYVLLGVEPELDCGNPAQALAAMQQAEFVVALSPYKHQATEYAHVLLPVSPFTETSGTFVSTEGRAQSFAAVVKPLEETRPAWKVLRVLGNLLGVAGFDQTSSEDARREVIGGDIAERLNNGLQLVAAVLPASGGVERLAEVPIYATDAIVRRAPSLQKTHDAAPPVAAMPGALFTQLGLQDGDFVTITQGGGSATLPAVRNDRLPANTVRVPQALPDTAALGDPAAPVALARVPAQQKVAV
jgi:NADH-quinone oxidoreductase subunit G